MLRIILFGLIVYLVARGLYRLVHSLTAPPDDEKRVQTPAQDRIDPRKIQDATFRDIDE